MKNLDTCTKHILSLIPSSLESATVNEDVIKEDKVKFPKVSFQYFIHDTLEGG
jgi:hypothetical protein